MLLKELNSYKGSKYRSVKEMLAARGLTKSVDLAPAISYHLDTCPPIIEFCERKITSTKKIKVTVNLTEFLDELTQKVNDDVYAANEFLEYALAGSGLTLARNYAGYIRSRLDAEVQPIFQSLFDGMVGPYVTK